MQHESKQYRRPRPFRRASATPLAAAALFASVLLGFAGVANAQISLQQALLLRSHGASIAAPTSLAALSASPKSTEDALHALADEASIIFAGEVVAIQADGAAIRIDLRVEDGIRGVTTGENFSMREWAGLWSANTSRYHVGQRALFFLHVPSVAGWTSPVGGADGVIPISGDRVTAAVDLRWIAARVHRVVSTRPDNAPDGTSPLASTLYPLSTRVTASVARESSARANGIAWPADVTAGNVLGPDLHSIDQTLITGLLRTWNSAAGTAGNTSAETR